MLPARDLFAVDNSDTPSLTDEARIDFFGDGKMFNPAEYIQTLQQVNATAAIEKDRYGAGGAVAALEKKFETITGKEKAVFMQSGTLANQLAISVLSGETPKYLCRI